MKTYVSTLQETDKYVKILSTAEKTDTLLLFYYTGEDQISLSVFNTFSSAKCKIQFEEIKTTEEEKRDLFLAYTFGMIAAKNPDIKVISSNAVLQMLADTFGSAPKPTRTRKKAEESKFPAMNPPTDPENSISQEIVDKKEESDSPAPKKRGRKNKDVNTTSKTDKNTEDDAYEKAFLELKALLDSVKTKEFAPADYMSSLTKAVRYAIQNKISLEEALSFFCSPAVSKKFVLLLKDSEKTLFEIVSRMVDEEL